MCQFAYCHALSLQTKQILPEIDAPDPPETSPSKERGVFKGRRKRTCRNMSYNTKKGSDNMKAARRPPQDNSVADDTFIELAAARYLHHIDHRLNPNKKQQLLIQQSIYLCQGDESILVPHSPITSGRS